MRAARFMLAFAGCSSFVSLAQCAVITVKPSGPISTIQGGINAAGPGDTVKVLAGVYSGKVVISSAKAGLKLIGVGNVVLDARTPTGGPVGTGLTVRGDGCLVRNLTVRHASFESADEPGDCVVVEADGITLDHVSTRRCAIYGISVTGNDATLVRCAARDCLYGIRVKGDNAHIEKCSVESTDSNGLLITGDDCVVRKNSLRGARANDELAIFGDGALVEQNVVREAAGDLIVVKGTGAIVRKNRLLGSNLENGILWEGGQATIENNIISDVAKYGIDALQTGGATIAHNRIERCAQYGIRATEEATTAVDLRTNTVRYATTGGIYAGCSFGAIEGNDVRNCGRASTSAGISIAGGSTVSGNLVRGCAGDGFRITSDDVVLSENRAIDNSVDGFDVGSTASNVTLSANIASKNQGEGIEVGGPSATLKGNVCSKNRIDLAFTVAPLSFSDNAYGSGGLGTAPQIE